jgi:hypothetical protein
VCVMLMTFVELLLERSTARGEERFDFALDHGVIVVTALIGITRSSLRIRRITSKLQGPTLLGCIPR